MDLFAALVALGRRWYLTIFLLIVVVGGTFVAAKQVKPDYKASASVILLAPIQTSTPGVQAANYGSSNSYLNAGPATFATVLSRVAVSDATKNEIASQGGTPSYDVGQGVSNEGPIVNITVTDPSPKLAAHTAGLLISLLQSEAAQLQGAAHAPTKTFMTIATVVSGDKPVALRGSRTRVVVAVSALGVIFMFILVLLTDAALTRRRRRHSRDRGRRPSSAVTDTDTEERMPDQGVPLTSAGW